MNPKAWRGPTALLFCAAASLTTGCVRPGPITSSRPKFQVVVDEAEPELTLGRGARTGGTDLWMREVNALKIGESALLLRADRMIETGQAAGAVEILRGLEERDPEDPRVFTRKGRALARLGDWPGAAAALSRASQLDPTDLGLARATASAMVNAADEAGALAAPIRIGVLADLQTEAVGAHEERAIELLLAEKPDLIVIPGDLFQGTQWQFERELARSECSLVDTFERRVKRERHRHIFGRVDHLEHAIADPRRSTVGEHPCCCEPTQHVLGVERSEIAQGSNTETPEHIGEFGLVKHRDPHRRKERWGVTRLDNARAALTHSGCKAGGEDAVGNADVSG